MGTVDGLSREIKFRAWQTSKKRMIYISAEEGNLWELHEKSHYPTMQRTGLKDKNGKDVYEGDIVFNESKGGKAVVEYWFYGYQPFMPKRGERLNDPDYYEVIGNVFENPELLETISRPHHNSDN